MDYSVATYCLYIQFKLSAQGETRWFYMFTLHHRNPYCRFKRNFIFSRKCNKTAQYSFKTILGKKKLLDSGLISQTQADNAVIK